MSADLEKAALDPVPEGLKEGARVLFTNPLDGERLEGVVTDVGWPIAEVALDNGGSIRVAFEYLEVLPAE